jgi:hypothetical protein
MESPIARQGLLQIGPDDIDQFLGARINALAAGRQLDVTANVVFEHLSHESIHSAPSSRNELKNVRTLSFFLQRTFDRLNLASDAANAFKQLFFLANRM